MRLKTMLVCALALSLLGFRAAAQSLAIDWSAIPGGGGVSANGQYSLAGSLGQSGAGAVMAGGNYSLTGGFWSLISVVQTPGAPVLRIVHRANQVIVSWPTPGTNWTLQQNSNLAGFGGWTTSGYPVAATNGMSSITISAAPGNIFFRLSQP